MVDDNQRIGFLKISGTKVYFMTRYNVDINIKRLLNLIKSSIYFKKKFKLNIPRLFNKDLNIKVEINFMNILVLGPFKQKIFHNLRVESIISFLRRKNNNVIHSAKKLI